MRVVALDTETRKRSAYARKLAEGLRPCVFWDDVLKPDGTTYFLMDGGVPVAGALVTEFARGEARVRYLCSVRRGAGRTLMRSIERRCKRSGYAVLTLMSTTDAAGFYDTLGYVRGFPERIKPVTRSAHASVKQSYFKILI